MLGPQAEGMSIEDAAKLLRFLKGLGRIVVIKYLEK